MPENTRAPLAGDNSKQIQAMQNPDKVFAMVGTAEGNARALAEIHKHKSPIYGADPMDQAAIIEVQADGSERRGRFVDSRFVPFVL
jgi:hypothetical protein